MVRHPRFILLLLGSLCTITPFAVDMYLPGFPAMAREFGSSTSAVSLSLSTYFIGFALGQLIYGPLLDHFGRKRPIYIGVIAYIVCSIGCALSSTLQMFALLRFFEALGGCVAQVGAIAMVQDFFSKKDSAKIFSLLFLMIGISPLLAPTIGSLLITGLGWRWIFGLLTANATLVLLCTWLLLPEGHIPDHTVSLKPGPMVRGYWKIFKQTQFITYTLAGGFSFSGLLAFLAGSSMLFMDGFHMSAKTFGMVFAALVMGFIGGNQLNILLLKKFTSEKIFFAAMALQTGTGIIFYIAMFAHLLALPLMMILFFVFLSCIGLTYPNSAALGLAPFSQHAGRASALLGFLQVGIGAVISMGIGITKADGNAVILLMGGAAAMGFVILIWGRAQIGKLLVNQESAMVMH